VRKLAEFALAASGFGGISLEVPLADPTLPFLILEDAFDSMLIVDCDNVWQIIDDHRDALATIVNLKQSYRMPLLRMSTSLMRRLSRTQHTVLLGRMLLTLAYMFPLTDRSGVNILGHFNSENVTEYEGVIDDQELFESTTKTPASNSNIEMSLPAYLTVFSCSPRNSSITQHLAGVAADVDAGRAASSDDFYRTFWRLQQYCCTPSKAVASTDAWALFTCSVRLVLQSFDRPNDKAGPSSSLVPSVVTTTSHEEGEEDTDVVASSVASKVSKSNQQGADMIADSSYRVGGSISGLIESDFVYGPQGWAPKDFRSIDANCLRSNAAVVMPADEFFGIKYLTNNRLLSLELQDSDLRRHVLLQLLILMQYLLQQKADADAFAAAEADKKKPSAGVPLAAPKKPRENFASGIDVIRDLSLLHALTFSVLRQTGEKALQFAGAVAALLHREVHWRGWKAKNAPEFEKLLPKRSEAHEDVTPAPLSGGKRKLVGAGFARTAKRSRQQAKRPLDWASSGLSTNLWIACAEYSRAPRHHMGDYVEPMRIALDSDSGIDEEYYPSTSKLYVWRTYRMMAAEKLTSMADASSLSFVDLICKVFTMCKPAKAGEVEDAAMSGSAAEPADQEDAPLPEPSPQYSPPDVEASDTTPGDRDDGNHTELESNELHAAASTHEELAGATDPQ
jgi:hypothetical protein